MGFLADIAANTMPSDSPVMAARTSPNAVAPVQSKVATVATPVTAVGPAVMAPRQSPNTTIQPVPTPVVTPPTAPAPAAPVVNAAPPPINSPTLSAQDAYQMYLDNNGGLTNGYDVNNAQQMAQIGAGTSYTSQLQNILSTPAAQNDNNPAYKWLVDNGYLTSASSSMSGNVELGSKGQDWMNVQNNAGVLSQGNPWGASPYQGTGAGLDVADRSQMGYNADYGHLATPNNLTYTMDNGIGNSIVRYGPALVGAGLAAVGLPTWALSGIGGAANLLNGGSVTNALANLALSATGALVPGAAPYIQGAQGAQAIYNTIQNPSAGNLLRDANLVHRFFPIGGP